MPPADDDELRRNRRPAFETGTPAVRVADLFCGCGGLTLGLAQAAQTAGVAVEVALAVDADSDAAAAYASNFPEANVLTGGVEDIFDGALGGKTLTEAERVIAKEIGAVHALIGGPPCQGHSDLNNHTRRADPKNAFYALMARAAAVLGPRVVLIENVPSVRHDKGGVVAAVVNELQSLGYRTAEAVLDLHRLGIAQRRRRHVLLASRLDADPAVVLKTVAAHDAGEADLRSAIGDLAGITEGAGLDQAPRASVENRRRMQWLIDNNAHDLPNKERPTCHQDDHSYKSMYGRLKWSEPAQTITSGYGSIGQGRYMHPELARALTPHEAARLQGLPDYFSFGETTKRAVLATMIGNAVPPALSRHVFAELLPALVVEDEAAA
ncbi:MAG TPA: DNA cytosine methyltransferase [Mycobacteriales bacterium]|nr:DNA cytosine methyltransferase [Mycobacteriales bacterium]